VLLPVDQDRDGDPAREEDQEAEGAASRALFLEGEAGIAKSRLWDHGVGLARKQGLRVLAARPAEAESALPYIALVDLVEQWLSDARRLPAEQAEALDAVSAARPANELVVARAVLSLLRAADAVAAVLLTLALAAFSLPSPFADR
jgi:hypothetical protein